MNRFRSSYRLLQFVFVVFLVSNLSSSGARLSAQFATSQQSPNEQGIQNQVYIPFSITGDVVVEQVADELTDPRLRHKDWDQVSYTAAELSALADPTAGLIPAEVRAAAATGPPNVVGQWSSVISTPLVPIFVSLMPNGKVIMWDYDGDSVNSGPQDDTRTAVWDPQTDTFVSINVPDYNLFCAGYVHLSDGRLFVAGGNTGASEGIEQTHIFDHNNNTWTRGPDMGVGNERWYPSLAALPNEELFIMAGDPDLHQVRQIDGTLRDLTGATYFHVDRDYVFVQTAPNGKVLYAGPESKMRSFDTSGTGTMTEHGPRDGWYRGYGSYAMYDIGKIIVSGGNNPALNTARLIDATGSTPTASDAASMIHARRQHNLTILPDGTVLATGGQTQGDQVSLAHGVYPAEVWDPATDTWTELASMAVTRQYHSVALLLPDGRVMTGGTGWCGECDTADDGDPYQREDIEYFSPPYLFDSSGGLATRPTISSVLSAVAFGQSFEINSPDATSIDKVSLIRLGAPTHAQDMGQRFIPLTFSASGTVLTATAPANANIAPPGYYMLFIVDSNGVPSIAEFIRVDEAITQIAPLNSISTAAPTFEWEPRPTATEYELTVFDETNNSIVFNNSGTPYAANAVCTGNDPATDTCSVQPSLSLSGNVNYRWLVKAIINGASGPWSIYP